MTTVYIISAPSGSGKSTLVNELRRSVSNLEFSVSYTTRPSRGSEQNGHEYFFISREEFESLLAKDAFLEHADVFGNYYGTARRFLDGASADVALDDLWPVLRGRRDIQRYCSPHYRDGGVAPTPAP